MKYFKVLVELEAESEDDLMKLLDKAKIPEPEWWCECGDDEDE